MLCSHAERERSTSKAGESPVPGHSPLSFTQGLQLPTWTAGVTIRRAAQAVGPGQTCRYLRLPDFDGVCDSALAAAVLSAFDDFGFASTLLAAEAAFDPVCRLFRGMFTTSSAVCPAARVVVSCWFLGAADTTSLPQRPSGPYRRGRSLPSALAGATTVAPSRRLTSGIAVIHIPPCSEYNSARSAAAGG